METALGTQFLLVHALAVKGVASEAALAETTGLPEEAVEGETAHLLAEGLVRQRKGRIGGLALIDAGREMHRRMLQDDVNEAAREALSRAYDLFLPLNGRFKQLCTSWQLKDVHGASQPNEHDDAEYDATVVAALAALHEEAGAVWAVSTPALSRFSRYPLRLEAALVRLQAGDAAAFTKPMTASHHDVWMELHQDLLISLGRARDARDEG